MTDAVFNPIAGAAGKRDGMDRAEQAANPEWWRFMWAALIETATRKPFLFTDDPRTDPLVTRRANNP